MNSSRLTRRRLTRVLAGDGVSRNETDIGHMPQVSLHSSRETSSVQASERGGTSHATLYP
jgi:hypothetical protein